MVLEVGENIAWLRKHLKNRRFLEKHQAQNLQDFSHGSLQFQFLPGNHHQHISAGRNPYLGLDGVGTGAKKALDAQILFNPFEEQFHLPAAFVELGDGGSGQREVVAQKDQCVAGSGVDKTDSPQGLRIEPVRQGAAQANGLIGTQSPLAIYVPGFADTEVQVVFGADDEKGLGQSEAMEAGKIDKAAIHDVISARFQGQIVDGIDFVHGSFRNIDKTGNIAAQVQERVQLDGAFGVSELRPGKEAEAEVDGGGIEDINRRLEPTGHRLAGVQTPGAGDEHQGKIRPDAPGAIFVGVGQRGTGNAAANAQVVELPLPGAQAGFDVAQRFAISELGKEHHQELIPAGEGPHPPIALITIHALGKLVA